MPWVVGGKHRDSFSTSDRLKDYASRGDDSYIAKHSEIAETVEVVHDSARPMCVGVSVNGADPLCCETHVLPWKHGGSSA